MPRGTLPRRLPSAPPPMTPSLSERLRAETRTEHASAERSGIVRRILSGRVTRGEYAVYLRNLAALYAALEAGLRRNAAHPAVAPLLPLLPMRTPALEADLEEIHGRGWPGLPLAAEAEAYAARLRALADREPELLVAHAYVRYLGDLSGGLMLRDRVAAALSLQRGDAGVRFYAFPGIADVAGHRARIRGALDALGEAWEAAPGGGGTADRVVAEALAAFVRHRRLFAALEAEGEGEAAGG